MWSMILALCLNQGLTHLVVEMQMLALDVAQQGLNLSMVELQVGLNVTRLELDCSQVAH